MFICIAGMDEDMLIDACDTEEKDVVGGIGVRVGTGVIIFGTDMDCHKEGPEEMLFVYGVSVEGAGGAWDMKSKGGLTEEGAKEPEDGIECEEKLFADDCKSELVVKLLRPGNDPEIGADSKANPELVCELVSSDKEKASFFSPCRCGATIGDPMFEDDGILRGDNSHSEVALERAVTSEMDSVGGGSSSSSC